MKRVLGSTGFRKWLALVITVISLFFFANHAVRSFHEIPSIAWSPWVVSIVILSVVFVVLGIIIVGTIWYILLRESGMSASWKQAQVIFSISQIGKYFPGNVGQYVGRVVMARNIGIPVPVTLSTMLVEMFWVAGTAAGLAVISIIFFVDDQTLGQRWQLGVVELVAILITLVIMPWLVIGLMNRCLPGLMKRLSSSGEINAPRLLTALAIAALFLLCHFLMGAILKLQAQWLFGISEVSLFELTCLFSVVWLAGYLLPGAPGGLGVREAMMVLLLSPVLGVGVAVGLGVTMRLTTTVGDAVAFAIGFIAKKVTLN